MYKLIKHKEPQARHTEILEKAGIPRNNYFSLEEAKLASGKLPNGEDAVISPKHISRNGKYMVCTVFALDGQFTSTWSCPIDTFNSLPDFQEYPVEFKEKIWFQEIVDIPSEDDLEED